MTDAFEDLLRRHLAEHAARIPATPDPGGFIHRSAGGRRRTVVVAASAVAVIVVAGAGVLGGANLAGGRSSSVPSRQDALAPAGPRAGSSVAPNGAGANVPTPVGSGQLTLLFTRTTPAGVTVRAYTEDGPTGSGCPAASCPPIGTVPGPTPCPAGGMCARPMIDAPPTSSSNPAGTGTTIPPSAPGTACGGLVVEMSTDRAVATATASWSTAPPADANGLDVLGTGSFGAAEGGSVSWIIVQTGSAIASVQLSGPGSGDAMVPSSGIAVLARPGGLDGAAVVGLDPGGKSLSTAPSGETGSGSGCAASAPAPMPTTTTSTTSTTSTPSTSPPATAPASTTTTTESTTTTAGPDPVRRSGSATSEAPG